MVTGKCGRAEDPAATGMAYAASVSVIETLTGTIEYLEETA